MFECGYVRWCTFFALLCYCCLSHGCGCTLFTTKTPICRVNNHGGRAGLTIQGAPGQNWSSAAPTVYTADSLTCYSRESTGVNNIININWLLYSSVPVRHKSVALSRYARNRDPDKEEATRKISHPLWKRPIKEDGLVLSGCVYSFCWNYIFCVLIWLSASIYGLCFTQQGKWAPAQGAQNLRLIRLAAFTSLGFGNLINLTLLSELDRN